MRQSALKARLNADNILLVKPWIGGLLPTPVSLLARFQRWPSLLR
jgi:hypothetical protein